MRRILLGILCVAMIVAASSAIAGLLFAVGTKVVSAATSPAPIRPPEPPPIGREGASEAGPVLDLLLRTTWTPRIFVDASADMDRRVRCTRAPADVMTSLGSGPYGATPRRIAARFVELFDDAARRAPTVILLAPGRPTGGLALVERTEPFDLGQLLGAPRTVQWGYSDGRPLLSASWEGPTLFVVIVGSPGMREAASSLKPKGDGSSSAVLVIDLSADGGGAEVARVLGARPRATVAYWRPIED